MNFDKSFVKKVLYLMEKEARKRKAPVFRKELIIENDPFKIFILAFLSSRTKDETTVKVCKRLFKRVSNFKDILSLSQKEIEKLIYGVGFYRQKAKNLKKTAEIIVKRYSGNLPNQLEELVKLPGVGNKIAKVILAEAYRKPYIAVDVHVHRISNRLGIVKTKTPSETDRVLDKIIPEELKRKYNKIFVAFGQTVCKPKRPLCNECPLKNLCPKIGI